MWLGCLHLCQLNSSLTVGVFASLHWLIILMNLCVFFSLSVAMSTTGDKILDTALSKVRLAMILNRHVRIIILESSSYSLVGLVYDL